MLKLQKQHKSVATFNKIINYLLSFCNIKRKSPCYNQFIKYIGGGNIMDIKYLQKLDFLLKIINSIDGSHKYKLVFGFKGTTYEGDFIPSTYYITPKTLNFKIK